MALPIAQMGRKGPYLTLFCSSTGRHVPAAGRPDGESDEPSGQALDDDEASGGRVRAAPRGVIGDGDGDGDAIPLLIQGRALAPV
jgi:hypothetical protein